VAGRCIAKGSIRVGHKCWIGHKEVCMRVCEFLMKKVYTNICGLVVDMAVVPSKCFVFADGKALVFCMRRQSSMRY